MTIKTFIDKLHDNYKLYHNSIYFENDFEITDYVYTQEEGLLLFIGEDSNLITPKILLPDLHKYWQDAFVKVVFEGVSYNIKSISTIQYPDEPKHINLNVE